MMTGDGLNRVRMRDGSAKMKRQGKIYVRSVSEKPQRKPAVRQRENNKIFQNLEAHFQVLHPHKRIRATAEYTTEKLRAR